MRTLVILNPMADHGRAGALAEKIITISTSFGEIDLTRTNYPGHAQELAQAAVDQGYELIGAAGGDGTVHEIINGLYREDRPGLPMGIIPVGSGNDFAHGLNLYADLETSLKRLFTGRPIQTDLARISDDRGRKELFNNGLGIGFDATVNIQSRLITRIHGFGMYFLATLRTIAFYYQTPRLQIKFDDQLVEQDALLLAVGLGPRIGGGFYLTPDAQFSDGLLDSCTVNPVSRLTMIQMLPRVMRGSHITSRHVTMRRSQIIELNSNQPLPIHIDGEIFAFTDDNVRQLKIEILPSALSLMG